MYYSYHSQNIHRIKAGELVGWEFVDNYPKIGECLVLYFSTQPFVRPIRPHSYHRYVDSLAGAKNMLYEIQVLKEKKERKMLNELIEKLNKHCSENEIYDIDDLSKELWDELKAVSFKYVTTVDHDEYRCYVLAENVYSVLIDGEKRYIGVLEVDTLKRECMSISDCGCKIKFYEMEQFTTVSYRRKGE